MTLARTRCVALSGLDGSMVEVEADLGNGIPGFVILGLPDASLREARERIKSAARNTGVALANRKLTVNLSPATLHKHGSGFDLAIVMAALAADGQVRPSPDTVYLAELGLDGGLRPIPGILPSMLVAMAAGHRRFVVSRANAAEARLVPGARVQQAEHLAQVLEAGGVPSGVLRTSRHHRGSEPPLQPSGGTVPDLAEVNGQLEARWALEVAAAGGHHLLLTGPPGAGKTLLASCLPSILPPLDRHHALEATAIRSISEPGGAPITGLLTHPPFIAPHHSASSTSLLGGGSRRVQLGAVTRAHRGVLFLDEAPLFDGGVLDALRQPLEEGVVWIGRTRLQARLPARFQLVMAANPCPCGNNYGTGTACTCTPMQRRRYFTRLSGPVLDRIDLQLAVRPVPAGDILRSGPNESSAVVAERVHLARDRARHRLARWSIGCNARVPGGILRHDLGYPPGALEHLAHLAGRAGLSARALDRVLRVAWTIADLNARERPGTQDLDLALHLRQSIES